MKAISIRAACGQVSRADAIRVEAIRADAIRADAIRGVVTGDLLKGNELDALLVSELKERPSGVVALLTVERMARAKHTNWHKTLTRHNRFSCAGR
jgi:hypothetical protein